ncbi:putative 2-(5''-triphosphoribosyl)-3'-dephosphocoenzyme-A synthase [Vallitalea longa]|uniref:triphosphoribosyl-dephospho-CoA synthase n=1 Tax=Vallitalea longa TaxID=2936439 RepID=A0A9W6DH26_9FIRM|nr:triphosphoribosyl-dephospho-CoA synthase [Vallitalea longa]GKX31023.1 putative 2-(5''-triphosphoribosyl)-3'-dephosphocoenzyme-A synthase [Vallitalea longa]
MKDIDITAKWISDKMNFSLMAEVVSWPSPGLVSPIDSGCHKDMDVYTFINSSIALSDYFYLAAKKGIDYGLKKKVSNLFHSLQQLGLEAETNMFQMTNGINTHKGMIFHGILMCAAAGITYVRDRSLEPEHIRSYISEIVEKDISKQFEYAVECSYDKLTTGLKAYCKYGLKGIRGEAITGYKSIFEAGLPALKDAMLKDVGQRKAIIHTLLVLMSRTEDTTLLNREFNISRIEYVRNYAQNVLNNGSIFSINGQIQLKQMCQDFKEKSLSPGGSADLTCVTLALYLWDSGYTERSDYFE